jgi:hypothetical protein
MTVTAHNAINLGIHTQASSAAISVGQTPAVLGLSPATARAGAQLLFGSRDELYYWTVAWQQGQAETEAALAAGEAITFDTDDPMDVARWLLSDD